jgi:hypothetical protein
MCRKMYSLVRLKHNEKVIQCGIYGEQSDIGRRFSHSTSVFPCQYHSTSTLYSFNHWGYHSELLVASGNNSVIVAKVTLGLVTRNKRQQFPTALVSLQHSVS